MKQLFLAAALVLFTLPAWAENTQCGPKDQVLDFYKQNGFSITVEAITGDGYDLLIVTSPKGEFSVIKLDALDGIACVVDHGVNFKIVPNV